MSDRRIPPPSWVRVKGNIRKIFPRMWEIFLGTTREVAIFLRFEKHLITLSIARPSNIFDKEKRYFWQFEKCLAKEYFSFLWSSRQGEKEEIRPLVSAFLFPHDLHFHIFLEMSQMKTKHLPTFRKKSENRPIFSQILTIQSVQGENN